nr:Chain D, Engineered Nuclear Export Signal Peptide (CPEB4 NES reverse mutant) [Homo sapiens]
GGSYRMIDILSSELSHMDFTR